MNRYPVYILLFVFVFAFGRPVLSQENPEEYRKTIEMADNYFAKGDYINAKASYQLAARMAPEDTYPKERLQLSLDRIRVQMQQNMRYTEKIMLADELYLQQNLEEALKVYREALDILPGDIYAADKVDEITKYFAKIRKDEEDYQNSLAAGDQYLAGLKYDEALAEYQKAASIKPDEAYPSDRITQLEAQIAEQTSLASDYEQALEAAETAITRSRFNDAILQLEQARAIRPEEAFPEKRLAEVRKLKEAFEAYQSIINEGDELYVNRKFALAKEKYQQALVIHPDDEYPKSMLQKIEIALMDITQANQASYEVAIALADKYYSEQDYEKAMAEYRNASRFKPDDTYAQQRIENISQRLDMRKMQEEAYVQTISKADNLFKEQRYEESKEEYSQAVGLKPMESYPKVKIDEINTILANLKNQRDIYSSLIKGADQLFFSDNYVEAKEQYRKAVDMFPNERYPQDQITMINEILGIRERYTRSVTRADKLLQDKKYDEALAEFRKASELDSKEVYPQGKIFELETLIEEEQQKQMLRREYDSVLAIADVHFNSGSYDLAMATYEAALEMIPSESYPNLKLREINKIYEDLAAKEMLEQQYADAISEGDRLLGENDYQAALSSYQSALSLKPGESYPQDKISSLNEILGEIAAREALERQYEELTANAEIFYSIKDYQSALAAYQSALNLKPGSKETEEKVAEISTILNEITEKEAFEKQYNDLISNADGLFLAGDYQAALAIYQQALGMKPGEAYPSNKIATVNSILSDIAEQAALDERYAEALLYAENLFKAQDYTNAIAAYQSAMVLKPDADIPQQKIAAIDKIIEEATAAREATERQYEETIAVAASYLAASDYQNALASYQSALNLKPGADLPVQKIAEINSILNEIAEKEAFDKNYAETLAKADKYFSTEDYPSALTAYQEALKMKPGEKYPGEMIASINSKLEEITALATIDKQYAEAISFAENHLSEKDYENARYEFQVANSIKPTEPYPLEKIAEIDALMVEIQRQREINNQYNSAIALADGYFKEEKFEEARASYRDAQKIKTEEEYPERQINLINNRLETLAQEREQAYQIAITRADQYLGAENYEMAKVQYDRAIELKPDELYPLDKLKQVNEQIMRKRQIIQAEYDKSIADADKFYASKIYDNAIDTYRAATLLKPDEEYPKEMVRRILKMLSDRSIVQMNRESLLIANNTQHRFDFLPVPVKDRRSNYIFFRARNASESQAEYKLIINFGKGQLRNGGVVVRVPPGEELNEYIVRISAQYKWFSDDNDWITFYPEGGDIEVFLVQISYSD
ncbi:MAG: hypothetical protein R6W71_07095 [Bacteroidales bacterium]